MSDWGIPKRYRHMHRFLIKLRK
ncbi:hypothetical protein GNT69_06670 [Bacillus sp. B15-48]|nr:hypothetical protein [Bacillus sp. B15-48]